MRRINCEKAGVGRKKLQTVKQVVRERLQTVTLMKEERKKVEFDKDSQRAVIGQFFARCIRSLQAKLPINGIPCPTEVGLK